MNIKEALMEECGRRSKKKQYGRHSKISEVGVRNQDKSSQDVDTITAASRRNRGDKKHTNKNCKRIEQAQGERAPDRVAI
eukprot:c13569_g1_i1 orf=309-548(-)